MRRLSIEFKRRECLQRRICRIVVGVHRYDAAAGRLGILCDRAGADHAEGCIEIALVAAGDDFAVDRNALRVVRQMAEVAPHFRQHLVVDRIVDDAGAGQR